MNNDNTLKFASLSTLFLTLHEVLAFSCPVPGRVIYSRNLDFCGGDVTNSGGKLSIQDFFLREGDGQHNFLNSPRDNHTQDDNTDKTRKFDQIS